LYLETGQLARGGQQTTKSWKLRFWDSGVDDVAREPEVELIGRTNGTNKPIEADAHEIDDGATKDLMMGFAGPQ
jgi:hypothetical protein